MSEPDTKVSWWSRLKKGLAKSSGGLAGNVKRLLTNRALDASTLDDLEDLLIQSDMGIEVAAELIDALRAKTFDPAAGMDPVLSALAEALASRLARLEKPLVWQAEPGKLQVMLVVGVNGAGKTTSIGKMAAKARAEGKKVIIAAGDTFRAAAIEQLKVWAERAQVEIVAGEQGADAAGLVYVATEKALRDQADLLIIDTAGRLQNKAHLMDELGKILRVIAKHIPEAPHHTLLVLDATSGQNVLSQLEAFQKTAGVTGLLMTKLDGTAKGGILLALAQKFDVPVHLIGVGEQVDDLMDFRADAFARALVGLDHEREIEP